MLDRQVEKIADEAVRDGRMALDDVVYLLGFDPYSPEAAYVCAQARRVGMRACGGRGFVYAQIGVDETACPENCRFCSFAAVNVDASTYDPQRVEVPLESIVHYATLFDRTGVDLISLMATAGLDFERYLEMVRAVRRSVSDDMVVMANAGDVSPEQARALKNAGATAAYHALRLGEGELTDIEPAARRRTMANLRDAGIPLMTGVEPVWADADARELAERIVELPQFEPFCVGACGLTGVAGIEVAGRKPAPTGLVRYVGALARLACGEGVPVGGIGGVVWVDAGCDPRSRGYGADDGVLEAKVAAARRRLAADGFQTA